MHMPIHAGRQAGGTALGTPCTAVCWPPPVPPTPRTTSCLHTPSCCISSNALPRLLPPAQLPAALCQAIGSLFGPLLLDARHAGPSIVLSSGAPDTGGAPGHPGSGAGAGPAAGFAEGFYDAARGSSGGGAGSGAGAAAGAGAGPAGAAAALPPAPEALESLLSMGFPRDQAVAALQQAGNDLQMAIALLVG